MKAIDKLIELRKEDPSIVAITLDSYGDFSQFYGVIPVMTSGGWSNDGRGYDDIEEPIDFTFDSENWKECIVTYKDLESYEIKMMSISVQEYERLVNAEKTLKNIQKFFI